jgi:serine/threonine protein kinase
MSQYKGTNFGTFNYLAPEVYLDYDGIFTRNSADVWSLGVIIYEMIYKKLPFEFDATGKFIDRKHI